MAVRFEWFHHLVTVPVRVGEVDATFVVDTGIGLPIVSSALLARADGSRSGETFTGRRMSGQAVELQLAAVPLTFAGRSWDDLVVGVADLARVDGFLSLDLLSPFVVDYASQVVRLDPLEGAAVPMRVHRDGISASPFVDLNLPNGETIDVEVDMGSDELILHERYLEALDVEIDRRVEGKDETGHAYVRTFGRLHGSVEVAGLVHEDPRVMFQSIIYDGLLGQDFLRRHVVGFDVENARIVFA